MLTGHESPQIFTDKIKGTFWGAEGAIQTYQSPFDHVYMYLDLREIQNGSPGDPH